MMKKEYIKPNTEALCVMPESNVLLLTSGSAPEPGEPISIP